MKRLLVPFVTGFLAGCLFGAALLVFDIGGLGTLVAGDRDIMLPVVMLILQLGSVFGVAMAMSVFPEQAAPAGRHLWLRPLAVRASSAVRRPLLPNK